MKIIDKLIEALGPAPSRFGAAVLICIGFMLGLGVAGLIFEALLILALSRHAQ